MPQAPRRRPSLEALESRHLPATFGIPWPDSQHLTLSLIPDGTPVGGAPSALHQTLGARLPAAAWELDVLRAFQSWAVLGDINIGLVADDGRSPGLSGPLQGDPRHGDIRVGARPLSPGTLALATPFDLGDSWSGAVLLNSRAAFGDGPHAPEDLFNALLHEAGHTLGLPDNPADPTSAMDTLDTGTHSAPSAADAAALRALYGPRRPDAGHDTTFATARPLAFDAPAAVAAELSSLTDRDGYTVTAPSAGPFAVALRTSGVSLLTARLTVSDDSGRPLATAAAADPLHGDLTVTVPAASAGARYFVRVEAARPDVFAIGSYRLAAGAPAAAALAVTAAPAAPAPVAAGLAPTTTELHPRTTGTDAHWPYLVRGALAAPDATRDYAIRTGPDRPGALLVTVWADPPGTLAPRVAVFDARHRPVAARVVAVDAASMSIQVLSPAPHARYVVEVSAAPGSKGSGGYTLGVTYRKTAIAADPLASGTLSGTHAEDDLTLNVADARVVHFALSAGTSAASGVALAVADAGGHTVETLRARGGAGVSGGDVVLPAGRYTLRVFGATGTGGLLPPTPYTLSSTGRSDPIGPAPTDTTFASFTLPPPPAPSIPPTDIVSTGFSIFSALRTLAAPFSLLWWD